MFIKMLRAEDSIDKLDSYSAKTNPLAKRGSTRMSARLDSVPSLVADSRGESSVL